MLINGVKYSWTNGTVENRASTVHACGVGFDSDVRACVCMCR